MDARYRAKNNIPVITKRFKDVAKLAIDRMEKSIEAGQGKKTYRDYIQAIKSISHSLLWQSAHGQDLAKRDVGICQVAH
jgi:hypothetical protein